MFSFTHPFQHFFLERIMSDALQENDGKVSIGERTISKLRFADNINALAEEKQELETIVESLNRICTRCKLEISAEKTKLMKKTAPMTFRGRSMLKDKSLGL